MGRQAKHGKAPEQATCEIVTTVRSAPCQLAMWASQIRTGHALSFQEPEGLRPDLVPALTSGNPLRALRAKDRQRAELTPLQVGARTPCPSFATTGDLGSGWQLACVGTVNVSEFESLSCGRMIACPSLLTPPLGRSAGACSVPSSHGMRHRVQA